MQAARPWIAWDSNSGSGEGEDTVLGRGLEPGEMNHGHEDCEDKMQLLAEDSNLGTHTLATMSVQMHLLGED